MANPQIEQGYTRIANEILEAMAMVKLSPTQYRILFVVWRYTYGFNRKSHNFSLGYFAEATGCDKRSIQRELTRLEEKQIILQEVKNGVGRIIEFNKNYEAWSEATIGETTNGQEPTIGETTNGETANGNLTNGETTNGSIGETTNGTIGETANQERKKERKKKEEEEQPQFGDPILNLLIQNNIIHPAAINYTLTNDLDDIENNFGFTDPKAMILEAVKDAARGNGRTWKFVYNKLNLWRKQGIKTVEDLERLQPQQTNGKNNGVDFTKFA